MEVGTLKQLCVEVGDVVELVHDDFGENRYIGILWTAIAHHPKRMDVSPVVFFKEKGTGWMSINDDSWIFRIISRANPKPKLWRDMTPEEKCALLLAHHEGKVIEIWSWDVPTWDESNYEFEWCDSLAYRIKPEPKVETVTKYRRADNGGWTSSRSCTKTTHKLTYNEIDGKPDCASIKVDTI